MFHKATDKPSSAFDRAVEDWQAAYAQDIGKVDTVCNRSGVEIEPLYMPGENAPANFLDQLGLPGQAPYTRGIYPTMHLSLIHI